MSATYQIKMHVGCLIKGNIWIAAKRHFHWQGIKRAITQLL
jgi:hypothetical protein